MNKKSYLESIKKIKEKKLELENLYKDCSKRIYDDILKELKINNLKIEYIIDGFWLYIDKYAICKIVPNIDNNLFDVFDGFYELVDRFDFEKMIEYIKEEILI